ncbi:L-valine transporter subunit YgaH [Kosakonia sacchari]|uniref:Branched-chain amino acid transport protein (AzlD) n=1 Tax=Kosakonia sacchari TaxID=1158459 RepID=A0A1G4YW98_9ENTR|nr:L-valine transporter subunit YgaH [Kosakonia sacchari]AHJ76912.1 valine transporter [Kosakonia sacchari SP1]ANR80354.1 valine transporter [Kosakonia sacchari]MDN2485559.1 L-valine transporter subunit YgaH [Kosakonia sacchari]NUL38109.1 L-valine transporter subunit YgaH [Kosakonia sacchari]SCX57729.1 Branched-chain amino acid transport protein (AzlD) [Kosakonia sacchari]
MRNEVLLLGLLVGCVNFLFRYLPLRIRPGQSRPAKRGVSGVFLDTIGIASICALLVVSCVPEIAADSRRLLPTLAGFAVLGVSFWKTRSIILPTLLSAFAYGIVWKLLTEA